MLRPALILGVTPIIGFTQTTSIWTRLLRWNLSSLLLRTPVQDYVERCGVPGIRSDDQKAITIRSDVPAHRASTNPGVHHFRIKERLRPPAWKAGREVTSTRIIFQSGEI